MKWSEMTPRQRDVALAEKQGWTDIVDSFGFWRGRPPWYVGPDSPPARRYIPKYTTDSAEALQLAECMADRGYWVNTTHQGAYHTAEHKYYCSIERRGPDKGVGDEAGICAANGDSYAEAVSRAVWAALGGEE